MACISIYLDTPWRSRAHFHFTGASLFLLSPTESTAPSSPGTTPRHHKLSWHVTWELRSQLELHLCSEAEPGCWWPTRSFHPVASLGCLSFTERKGSKAPTTSVNAAPNFICLLHNATCYNENMKSSLCPPEESSQLRLRDCDLHCLVLGFTSA